MKRQENLEKKGYKIAFVMNTSDGNHGHSKVAVSKYGRTFAVFSSVTAAHKKIIGY